LSVVFRALFIGDNFKVFGIDRTFRFWRPWKLHVRLVAAPCVRIIVHFDNVSRWLWPDAQALPSLGPISKSDAIADLHSPRPSSAIASTQHDDGVHRFFLCRPCAICKANKAMHFLIGETVVSTDGPDPLNHPAFTLGGLGSDVQQERANDEKSEHCGRCP
jgi:hypothetical protein